MIAKFFIQIFYYKGLNIKFERDFVKKRIILYE